jgi:hypothetical protein
MSHGWQTSSEFPWPTAPFNGRVVSPLTQGIYDIRWDDPSLLAYNTSWNVVGVNVYRSDVGERGPYHRLNTYPLGGSFYRDATTNVRISNEMIPWEGGWLHRGDAPNSPRWVLRTQYSAVKPLVNQCVYANAAVDVIVTVDGNVAEVDNVFGRSGEIELVNIGFFDELTEEILGPELPIGSGSLVLVTYTTNRNFVKFGLDEKIYYRLTTVAFDACSTDGLVETPLDYCQPLTPIEMEPQDYVWREGIRRNNWVLEQGGERVLVFIKKTAGYPCNCGRDARTLDYSKQPDSRCVYCYGTGYLGGYEGPYPIIIAPDDAERRVAQTPWGRTVEHNYEVWTGPTPMLSQRDFVVRQTNERYSIGPTRKPTNRGNILQQHFGIKRLDEEDIRYKVPIDGISELPWPETRTTVDPREGHLVFPLASYGPMVPIVGPDEHGPQVYPQGADAVRGVQPMNTEKSNIPDNREHRGGSATWENWEY